MSALRLAFARRAVAPLATRTALLPARPFHSCRVLAVGNESELHNENRGEEAEAHKQDQLQKQKEGKGEWKGELASESESMIKADRNEMGNAEEDIEKLQKKTTELANDKKL
ncbi:hypothetical protein B0A54_12302 [Friedmanniomyces endolithicus]|uniref:Uncharacterized protein n=1 Tax=Friedmanniomyces endolithicus TaxID=329885 RepID=A0A4U0ULT8_9PEZI|nr:hypothetical protein LTS09_006125 [Friedmanniomyces endolithicus]TKA35856.1 hypothetical protein B0A54_12302 [Friedmanniomyces endolithicus]